MSLQKGWTSEVIIARSKRTGTKYAIRTSDLMGYHEDRSSYLHYTDSTRSETCRCLVAQKHQKPYPVSDDDKNLEIAINRYMDKFDLKSCHQSEFSYYRERQKISWALKSVHAERFHYVSKEKNVVCRCNKPSHLSCRRVRNPEIQELCAEFFLFEVTENVCTRDQWRATAVVTTTSTRSTISRRNSDKPAMKYYSSPKGPLEYTNASKVELLQVREAQSTGLKKEYLLPSVNRNASPSSSTEQDVAPPSNGPNGERDVPELVWRVSRPSMYSGQSRIQESLMSTPIGSSATPVQQKENFDLISMKYRTPSLAIGNTAPRIEMYADAYCNVGQGGSVSELHRTSKYPDSHTSGSPKGSIDLSPTYFNITGLEVSFSGAPRFSAQCSSANVGHIVGLSSPQQAIELDSSSMLSPIQTYSSLTSFELEGISKDYVAELAGQASRTPSRCSRKRNSPRRLTYVIDQPSGDSKLPSPQGDCSQCQNSLHAPNKKIIRLTCGHLMHHECLTSNFRVLDFEFGKYPLCDMALCERTLHDRIDTDREAIFGQSLTGLKAEERIVFAQRGESVVCWSEEEVAAAQLRLLKDYVDAHADELFGQWQQMGLEPDWHNAVVTPVVQLFKGWNVPTRNCRYFADRDAFYKLVVWAELVRLMNTIRGGVKTLHGDDAPFPQLSELQRKFMMAKERYEIEKKAWPMNQAGVLMCEKVAQDAFSMAVALPSTTHSAGSAPIMDSASDTVSSASDLSASHLSEETSTGQVQLLPSQKDYLKALSPLRPDWKPVALGDPSVNCGICLESFAEFASKCVAHASCRGRVVVALTKCQHLFHYRCIALWHACSRPERNTCPNCRRELYVADPLTQEQIQQQAGRGTLSRREDILPNLQTNEMLVPGDVAALTCYARQCVHEVICNVQKSRYQRRVRGHYWIAVCQQMRDLFLPQGGAVRPIFQVHGHDFVDVVIAAAVLCQITRYPSATRTLAFRRLVGLVDLLIDRIGDGGFQSLYSDFRRNGLFQTDSYCVVPVNDTYIRFYLRTVARIRLVSAEMKARVQGPRWKEALRCVKPFAILGLEPAHSHRTNKTLAEVLGRIPDGGLLHCLSRTPGQRTTGNGALGVAWDEVLLIGTGSGPNAAPVI
ncbi:hypothetical protein SVAN01_11123 [Stagonosporopsis vannaccii]|nr:hypothetical protein SVAN01_11123 [Stagonosporopsis vannaccii]